MKQGHECQICSRILEFYKFVFKERLQGKQAQPPLHGRRNGCHDVFTRQILNIVSSSQNLLFLTVQSNFLGETLVKRGLWKMLAGVMYNWVPWSNRIGKNNHFYLLWELLGL